MDETIVDDDDASAEIVIYDAPRPSLVMNSSQKARASMLDSPEKETSMLGDPTVETQPNMIHLTNLGSVRRETTHAGDPSTNLVDDVAIDGDDISVGDPDVQVEILDPTVLVA